MMKHGVSSTIQKQQQSMQGKTKNSVCPKVTMHVSFSIQIHASVPFDPKGIIHYEFMVKRSTIARKL